MEPVSSANARATSETPGTSGVTTGDLAVHHTREEVQRSCVLMSTAIVDVAGHGYNCQLRALLDSASEVNFITLSSCKKLGLKLDSVCQSISGLSNMTCTVEHSCQLKLKSRTSDFELDLHCLVIQKITKKLPSVFINSSQLHIPENIKLADPFFYNPGNIDILIGGEFFFKLLTMERIELNNNLPTLQNSKLGWIISGPIPDYLITNKSSNYLSSNLSCLFIRESINETLLKFWELEEYPAEKSVKLSVEEQRCEEHFINTMSRDVSGRFVVRLPFRDNKNQLGDSREIALRRLSYLERKFKINQEFYNQYSSFMREYIKLNHMSIVNSESTIMNPTYLPHHGVLHEFSLTTKLRVVFDGSVRTTAGISLNDTLMIGARLQDNLIDIMLRFRLHAIAITADLKKMYRQILVHEADKDYQRILWRSSVGEPIREFRLNTVTYGLSCAPFLAVRCVRHVANNADDRLMQASQVLLNDLYVDDILTGVSSIDEATDLIKQLKELFK
ncbi:PREDICTED: uncharacterized protein LOC105557222 [Vollenhovia emeryi]|uniref:uncharacterized protein LOC105557222 n=1 Tax=Vollenhovia emeryi TaxID=411798 RepID=UPI0005F49945|nr:PREDICTED: uncharacterized protein LOC105557222 [Vollenhovia emeryi]